MHRKTNDNYLKKRKPIIALVCEGKNQTEKNYFKHFIKRENSFVLKIFPSEATDPKNMIKKAKFLIKDLEMDSSIGDRMFCLIDLDLSQNHCNIVENEINNNSKSKCKVEFILSNPCFEIWFLYYFTKYPKIENSSQNVKKQLKNDFVHDYSENYDIYENCNLQDKHSIAINNAILRQQQYDDNMNILDKNPYTEVPKILEIIL